ncbi:MAG: hypothetical protein ABIJ56_07885 [Pseudomonadota bacterium]
MENERDRAKAALWAAAASACCLFAGPAFGDTVVVDDALDSDDRCSGTVVGIAGDQGFIDGVGWEQRNSDARIEYDFGPEGMDRGVIELDVANFDPTTQMVGMTGTDDYHNLLSFYEGPGKQHHQCYDNLESCMEIQVVGRDESSTNRAHRVKYLITTWNAGCDGPPGHCNGMYTQPSSGFDWDLSKTYRFRLEWSLGHGRMTVTELPDNRHSVEYDLWWDPEAPECTLNLRYFFIGRDEGNYGKPVVGPVWSNLKVTSLDDSAYCGNGSQEGSEECDRSVPGGTSCETYGFYSGDLACDFCDCAIITDGCSGYCGDSECQAAYEGCASCPEDCGECEDAQIEEPAADVPDDALGPDAAGDAALDGDAPDGPEDGALDPGGDDGPGTGYEAEGGCGCAMAA